MLAQKVSITGCTESGHLQRLHALTEALSGAVRQEEAASIVLNALHALAPRSAVIASADEHSPHLRFLATEGLIPEHKALTSVPVTDGYLLSSAVRTGGEIWIERSEEWAGYVHTPGVSAAFALPITLQGRPVGSLSMGFEKYRTFSEDTRIFLRTAAELCAQAFHRAALLDEQRRSLDEQEQFLSITSHELRSPLTALRLKLESLGFKFAQPVPPTPVAARDVLMQCERLLMRADGMIGNLLDQAKVATGQLGLERRPVDLGDVLRFVAETQEQAAQQSHASISYQPPAEPIAGRWDSTRIEQVATNLVVNALKYGQGKAVQVRAGAHNGWAWFEVADRGPGIAPERLGRIFERYNRAGRRDASGLGLGLYLSRELVRAHGGYIRVDSQLGVGCKFTVFLPLD